MTVINKKVRRDVIPRWRLSSAKIDADSSPIVRRKKALNVGPQQDPADLLRAYGVMKRPVLAAEALSSAMSLNDKGLASSAARILSGHDLTSRPLLDRQIKRILAEEVDDDSSRNSPVPDDRLRIRAFKSRVQSYPRSSLAWLDLAFAYTSLGRIQKAENAVAVAVSIDPNHRAVVRSASRFFVHAGEFDRALDVIKRSRLLKVDPWLLSAHIATARAGGRTSDMIGAGRKMLKEQSLRPDQISELGLALATNEMEHGNSRLAKRLIDKSLVHPTENAVAQITWLEATTNSDFEVAGVADALPDAWEARTFELFEKREWAKSCEEAMRWLCDQPFSSRPAVHGSYVAATFLEDYELALKFSELGYRANPTDVIVANNYAVALAETGGVDSAKKVLSDALRVNSAAWRWTLRATEGLLLYREGSVGEGRLAYEEARGWFVSQGDERSALLAAVYQAREELRIGNALEAIELVRPLMASKAGSTAPDHEALKLVADGLVDRLAGSH